MPDEDGGTETRLAPVNGPPLASFVRSTTTALPDIVVTFCATATGRDVSHVYNTAGNFLVRMTVTDPGGRRAVALLNVSPGNTPPTVQLQSPAEGSLYRAGQRLVLRATAADAEDGAVPDRDIEWEGILHHRGHEHFLLSGLTGATAGFRVPSDPSADSFFEKPPSRV